MHWTNRTKENVVNLNSVCLPLFLFLSVAAVALFSFIAVAVWSTERRREREAYYRSETIREIAETQNAGSSSAIEFLREEDKISARRRREGLKLAGLITIAVGIALMIFLRSLHDPNARQTFLSGLIPLFIGVVLLVYSLFPAPKQ
jgi:hypothetical protein